MLKLFGLSTAGSASPSEAAAATEASTKQIRDALALLDKREAHLEKKCQDELRQAKARMAGNDKRAAASCLQRKKVYEGEIAKLYGSRLNLEQQLNAIDSSGINQKTMQAMQSGKNAMQQIHQGIDVDQVDDTMTEVEQQMKDANKIGEALGQSIVPAGVLDMDELDAELAALEQGALDDQLLPSLAATVAVRPVTSEASAVVATLTATAPKPRVVLATSIGSSTRRTRPTANNDRDLRQLEADMGM